MPLIITDTLCTASVRAVTYCDMAILMQEHFQQARSRAAYYQYRSTRT